MFGRVSKSLSPFVDTYLSSHDLISGFLWDQKLKSETKSDHMYGTIFFRGPDKAVRVEFGYGFNSDTPAQQKIKVKCEKNKPVNIEEINDLYLKSIEYFISQPEKKRYFKVKEEECFGEGRFDRFEFENGYLFRRTEVRYNRIVSLDFYEPGGHEFEKHYCYTAKYNPAHINFPHKYIHCDQAPASYEFFISNGKIRRKTYLKHGFMHHDYAPAQVWFNELGNITLETYAHNGKIIGENLKIYTEEDMQNFLIF